MKNEAKTNESILNSIEYNAIKREGERASERKTPERINNASNIDINNNAAANGIENAKNSRKTNKIIQTNTSRAKNPNEIKVCILYPCSIHIIFEYCVHSVYCEMTTMSWQRQRIWKNSVGRQKTVYE